MMCWVNIGRYLSLYQEKLFLVTNLIDTVNQESGQQICTTRAMNDRRSLIARCYTWSPENTKSHEIKGIRQTMHPALAPSTAVQV